VISWFSNFAFKLNLYRYTEVDRLTRELESAEEGTKAAERRRGAAEAAGAAAKHAAELRALADQLAEITLCKEAAQSTVDDLKLELALVAENGAALEAALEAARQAAGLYRSNPVDP
jgi:hypothetical protein